MGSWSFSLWRLQRRARQLGIAMLADPVIRPHLQNVEQYPDYARFVIAHRAYWEQSDRFTQYYQEHLFALAERHAARIGKASCDSIDTWDIWYNQVVRPLTNIMWSTWEQKVQLETLYNDALWQSRVRSAVEMSKDQRSAPVLQA